MLLSLLVSVRDDDLVADGDMVPVEEWLGVCDKEPLEGVLEMEREPLTEVDGDFV